jgi:hypothetical protein
MTTSADLPAIHRCIEAEIARARLEELIAECCDADVIWLSDVIQEAFTQSALAARAQIPPPGRTPEFVRLERRKLSFKD